MARDPLRPCAAPTPSRADSRAIVDAIVDATIELASPDVTTIAIAERAGVGIASLYRYFPNRGALFAEVSRRLMAQMTRRMRVVLAHPGLTVAELADQVARIVVEGGGVSNELRHALNVVIPFSWVKSEADDSYRQVLDGIERWMRRRLVTVVDDLSERVFIAFATVRGIVAMAMTYPELAPQGHDLRQMIAETLVDHAARFVARPRLARGSATDLLPVRARPSHAARSEITRPAWMSNHRWRAP